jgi:DNA-binding NarL/FixJ family response regulator
VCSVQFEPTKSSQVYCSRSCATKAGYRRRLGRPLDEKDSADRRKTLSPEDVEVIKELLAEGHANAVIAETFEVAPSTISAIKLGRNWA